MSETRTDELRLAGLLKRAIEIEEQARAQAQMLRGTLAFAERPLKEALPNVEIETESSSGEENQVAKPSPAP